MNHIELKEQSKKISLLDCTAIVIKLYNHKLSYLCYDENAETIAWIDSSGAITLHGASDYLRWDEFLGDNLTNFYTTMYCGDQSDFELFVKQKGD